LAALENQVKAVWFAFGADLGRWVQSVRDYDRKVKKEKTIVFVQISTVDEALVAINDWKVDVLVAQGIS
jgi:nitronate monooxygenase